MDAKTQRGAGGEAHRGEGGQLSIKPLYELDIR